MFCKQSVYLAVLLCLNNVGGLNLYNLPFEAADQSASRVGPQPGSKPGGLRLRGGRDLLRIERLENDMYRMGKHVFNSPADAYRTAQEPYFVKAPGSILNPAHWFTFLRHLLVGDPQRTVGMRRVNTDSHSGPLVMIDGADDLATALQGSGLPQQVQFALQAFLLYPIVLPIVELGFKGAADDREENQAEAKDARADVELLKSSLLAMLLPNESLMEESEAWEAMQRLKSSADVATTTMTMTMEKPKLMGTKAALAGTRDNQGKEVPRRRGERPTEEGSSTLSKQYLKWSLRNRWQRRRNQMLVGEHFQDEQFVEDAITVLSFLMHGTKSLDAPLQGKGREERLREKDKERAATARVQVHDWPSESVLEQMVRLLAALDGVVTKAWEPRVRADLTSPLAMFATATMWWSMLCHELAAFSGFIQQLTQTSALSSFATACKTVANWMLPVGQLGMSLYGLSVGINGVREAFELAEKQEMVRESKMLDKFSETKTILLRQLSHLAQSTFLSEILAGFLLFFGQLMMTIGCQDIAGKIYFLLFGISSSAVAIVMKTYIDLDTEKKFGYDEDILSVPQILINHVPKTIAVCSHQSDFRAIALVQAKRERLLWKLAWMKALTLIDGKEEEDTRRRVAAGDLYKFDYDLELREFLHMILTHADSCSIFTSLKRLHADSKHKSRRQQDPLLVALSCITAIKALQELPIPSGCIDEDECIAGESEEGFYVKVVADKLEQNVMLWMTYPRSEILNLVKLLHFLCLLPPSFLAFFPPALPTLIRSFCTDPLSVRPRPSSLHRFLVSRPPPPPPGSDGHGG